MGLQGASGAFQGVSLTVAGDVKMAGEAQMSTSEFWGDVLKWNERGLRGASGVLWDVSWSLREVREAFGTLMGFQESGLGGASCVLRGISKRSQDIARVCQEGPMGYQGVPGSLRSASRGLKGISGGLRKASESQEVSGIFQRDSGAFQGVFSGVLWSFRGYQRVSGAF